MPSKSKKQQALMAIAEHNPDDVYLENKSVLKMSKNKLHDFASTKAKGLPVKSKKEKHTVDKEQRKQIKDIIK